MILMISNYYLSARAVQKKVVVVGSNYNAMIACVVGVFHQGPQESMNGWT